MPVLSREVLVTATRDTRDPILNRIGIHADSLFGGDLDTWLIIDETPYYSKLTKM